MRQKRSALLSIDTFTVWKGKLKDNEIFYPGCKTIKCTYQKLSGFSSTLSLWERLDEGVIMFPYVKER